MAPTATEPASPGSPSLKAAKAATPKDDGRSRSGSPSLTPLPVTPPEATSERRRPNARWKKRRIWKQRVCSHTMRVLHRTRSEYGCRLCTLRRRRNHRSPTRAQCRRWRHSKRPLRSGTRDVASKSSCSAEPSITSVRFLVWVFDAPLPRLLVSMDCMDWCIHPRTLFRTFCCRQGMTTWQRACRA